MNDQTSEIERLRALLRELDESDYEPSLALIDRVEAALGAPADEMDVEPCAMFYAVDKCRECGHSYADHCAQGHR